LEEILTHNFFRYRSWFEAFPHLFIGGGGGVALKGRYLHITVAVGGPLWQHSTCTLQLLFEFPLKLYYLHITVAGRSESKVLAH